MKTLKIVGKYLFTSAFIFFGLLFIAVTFAVSAFFCVFLAPFGAIGVFFLKPDEIQIKLKGIKNDKFA